MKPARLMTLIGAVLTTAVATAPLHARQATKPPVMTHDAAGRAACLMCHAAGTMEAVADVPESHTDFTNEVCGWCHFADAEMQSADPPAMAHKLEGQTQCMMCHTPGRMEPVPDAPASHEGREDKTCTMCHAAPAGDR